MANGPKKGFGPRGMKRTEHFLGEDMAYIETRPDLREVYDDQFTSVVDEELKTQDGSDPGRGYIPSYEGRTRKDADHGVKSFFDVMQSRRPKP